MNEYVFGLRNLGNTCYLNSAIQLLCLNPDFASIENLSKNQDSGIKQIKKKIATLSSRFSGFSQEDSGEALLLLLYYYGKKYKNLKDYHFTEITRIKCKLLNCLHEEISKRKSDVLLLDINDSDDLDTCYRNIKNSTKLQGEEAWECNKCKERCVSSKRFYFEDWSKYLIVGLKRFYYRGTRYVKDNKNISIPLEWRHDYKLKGAIIHSGSLHGGHYICIGKKNGKWYEFNDSTVREIKSRRVLNNYLCKSYFLLFES